MNTIIKIVKSPNDSGLLIKGVTETVKNDVKEQKGRCFGMLAATLAYSLLGSMLSGKEVIRAGERTIRAGLDF